MAFDYSSTVSAIVLAMAAPNRTFTVVVPESRTISGGARYLEEFIPAGLTVRYLPDAAIEYGLGFCDAALFGVETLRSDGSFLNTIGSRMIAKLARLQGIEVYGCTDLLKLDLRSYSGCRPVPALRSYDKPLLTDLSLPGLSFAVTTAPELEVVPSRPDDRDPDGARPRAAAGDLAAGPRDLPDPKPPEADDERHDEAGNRRAGRNPGGVLEAPDLARRRHSPSGRMDHGRRLRRLRLRARRPQGLLRRARHPVGSHHRRCSSPASRSSSRATQSCSARSPATRGGRWKPPMSPSRPAPASWRSPAARPAPSRGRPTTSSSCPSRRSPARRPTPSTIS